MKNSNQKKSKINSKTDDTAPHPSFSTTINSSHIIKEQYVQDRYNQPPGYASEQLGTTQLMCKLFFRF